MRESSNPGLSGELFNALIVPAGAQATLKGANLDARNIVGIFIPPSVLVGGMGLDVEGNGATANICKDTWIKGGGF